MMKITPLNKFVKETQIQVAVDEDDYNSLSSDLQGVRGRFYAIKNTLI